MAEKQSPLTPTQIDLLQRIVSEDGITLKPEEHDDAERLDELLLVGVEWEEGIADAYPFDSGEAVAATLNSPLYREREALTSGAPTLLREIVSDSLNDTGDSARYSVDARLLNRASDLLAIAEVGNV